jgi:hypothetical protein
MRTRFPVLLAAGLLAGWNSPARAQDDARAVIARAIEASGGAARLNQLATQQAKARGTVFPDDKTTIPFTAETFVQLPGQFKNVMTLDVQGKKLTLVQVLDGNQGWVSLDGKTTPLDEQMLAETKERLYADRLSRLTDLLKEGDFQLALLPDVAVNGQPAIGVKVVSKGHKDVSLYFDKATGLLVKSTRQALNTNQKKEVLQEEFYSDFKEIAGLKRPTKILVQQDGRKFMEGELLDVKPVDKFPEGTFARP